MRNKEKGTGRRREKRSQMIGMQRVKGEDEGDGELGEKKKEESKGPRVRDERKKEKRGRERETGRCVEKKRNIRRANEGGHVQYTEYQGRVRDEEEKGR